MVSLELNQDHCIRCGRCISVCPQRILGRHTNGSVDVLHGALARCIRCGHCVAVCPKAALTLEHIAPSSLPLVEDAPLSDLQRDMLFKTRRSTRAYKDEPVDRNVLLKALEEARYAPTASNCEEVAWLLVEGRDRLHDLASRVADWMSTLTGKYSHVASAFRAGQDPILRGAPSLILAHSYGIGTCWSGFVIAAASNGVDLGIPLPEGRKICGGLMIGYPAVQYARVPPRKPVRLTVIE